MPVVTRSQARAAAAVPALSPQYTDEERANGKIIKDYLDEIGAAHSRQVRKYLTTKLMNCMLKAESITLVNKTPKLKVVLLKKCNEVITECKNFHDFENYPLIEVCNRVLAEFS